MGVDLLSGFGRVQPYYKASQIPTVTPEEIKKQQEQINGSTQAVKEEAPEQAALSLDNRSKAADLSNISLTFNREESFDFLGSESSLMNLDLQKAISDMRKDSILQEYQYFVGSSVTFMNTEDGLVFKK